MVLVTVGNARQGFVRLLTAVDNLANEGFFEDEPIIMQIGHSDFSSIRCDCSRFIDSDEFATLLANAGTIICHGGSVQLEAVKCGKVPVVMPRRREYGEVVNDHQVAFVRTLSSDGWVVAAYEVGDLPGALAEVKGRRPRPVPTTPMLRLVGEAIVDLLGTDY